MGRQQMKLENTCKLAVTPSGPYVNSVATTDGLHRQLHAVATIVAEISKLSAISSSHGCGTAEAWLMRGNAQYRPAKKGHSTESTEEHREAI